MTGWGQSKLVGAGVRWPHLTSHVMSVEVQSTNVLTDFRDRCKTLQHALTGVHDLRHHALLCSRHLRSLSRALHSGTITNVIRVCACLGPCMYVHVHVTPAPVRKSFVYVHNDGTRLLVTSTHAYEGL